jgi:hypothetical protein
MPKVIDEHYPVPPAFSASVDKNKSYYTRGYMREDVFYRAADVDAKVTLDITPRGHVAVAERVIIPQLLNLRTALLGLHGVTAVMTRHMVYGKVSFYVDCTVCKGALTDKLLRDVYRAVRHMMTRINMRDHKTGKPNAGRRAFFLKQQDKTGECTASNRPFYLTALRARAGGAPCAPPRSVRLSVK